MTCVYEGIQKKNADQIKLFSLMFFFSDISKMLEQNETKCIWEVWYRHTPLNT